MRTTLEPASRNEGGYALLITFAFVIITIGGLTAMLLWTSNNNNLNQRNNTFNQSTAAAEAATEKVFTTMDRDFLYGNLNTSSNQYDNSQGNSMLPDTSNTNLWPVQYTFSDTSGNANVISVSIGTTNFEPLNSQYAGLQGIAQDCVITAVATPVNQRFIAPATVSQAFQAAIIPVFQFAIFYNLDLEIDPGQNMAVTGPVFCNASIWAEGPAGLSFSKTVQAVGTVNTTTSDPFATSYTSSGAPTFSLAGQPTSGANSLTMPIGNSTNSDPTNVESILNLPPTGLGAPNTTAYAPSNQIYLFNESDLIISNASYGINGVATPSLLTAYTDANSAKINPFATNFTIWYQDYYNSPKLKQLTNDYYIFKKPNASAATLYKATNILYAGFTFLTNITFTDWRESATVQAVQIDIAKFNTWLTNQLGEGPARNNTIHNDLGHGIGSIYVYNKVALSASQLPAVRLVNGSVLPTNYPGLTVSTPQPLYIYSNFNVRTNATKGGNDIGIQGTTHTYPAAVLADAVTVLSTNWDDATSIASKIQTPSDTTVNCAMLEGIVQTDPDISGDYSGGVENFMRLLENWSNHTLTYNGSIVVMFPSIYATNHWSYGTYYDAPTRHWAFDNNFTQPGGLPPLTPSSRALIRNNWFAY